MSLFPRAFDSPSPSFTPLFQLLEDFDSYSRQFDSGHSHGIRGKFNPNFDLRELPDSYHLHGELPGVERGDVEMEFTGPHTLLSTVTLSAPIPPARQPQALSNDPLPAVLSPKVRKTLHGRKWPDTKGLLERRLKLLLPTQEKLSKR
jgi:hypothetical protein